MPRGDVSAARCVPGGDERLWVDGAAPWGQYRPCGDLVTPGKPFCRFSGCRRALACEQTADGAVGVPPAELRGRVPAMTAPGPEALAPASDG
jgi:hypothetical protein